MNLLFGVDGAGLGDDVAEGDAVGEEVVAADAAFGIAGVLSLPPPRVMTMGAMCLR